MIIRDGSGKGYATKVRDNNRLDSTSIVVPIEQYVSKAFGKAFTLPFDGIDPVGADDYFFYISNTGSKNLHIPDIRVRSTVAGTVEIHYVTGTASYTSDTDVIPVNHKIGDSNTITLIAKTDTNTTGLTNEGVLEYMRLDTVNKDYDLHIQSTLTIPPGQSIALLWDTSTGILSGTISIYEDQDVV